MIKDLSQNTVLLLIRMVVNRKSVVDEHKFEDVPWLEVMDVATNQGILGLCFEAIEHLPSHLRPKMDVLMVWLGQVIFMKSCYNVHKKTIAELARFYGVNDIKMLLLKGYGLSKYWPMPNHRPVGDVDSFNFGKHETADALVRDMYEVEIDDRHHKHSVFSFPPTGSGHARVTVENHYSFLNAHGHKSTAEIEDILHTVIDEIEDDEIMNLYYPSIRFNSLYLLRHSGEHFASVDMTLRQVLDWAFFVRASKVDWKWLLAQLENVGMKQYLEVLNAICVRYLGFDAKLFPDMSVDDALVERSLNDILHPEVEKEKHANVVREVLFRFKRWWKNGWKHDMVYSESRWQSLRTQIWSHILKPTL